MLTLVCSVASDVAICRTEFRSGNKQNAINDALVPEWRCKATHSQVAWKDLSWPKETQSEWEAGADVWAVATVGVVITALCIFCRILRISMAFVTSDQWGFHGNVTMPSTRSWDNSPSRMWIVRLFPELSRDCSLGRHRWISKLLQRQFISSENFAARAG